MDSNGANAKEARALETRGSQLDGVWGSVVSVMREKLRNPYSSSSSGAGLSFGIVGFGRKGEDGKDDDDEEKERRKLAFPSSLLLFLYPSPFDIKRGKDDTSRFIRSLGVIYICFYPSPPREKNGAETKNEEEEEGWNQRR